MPHTTTPKGLSYKKLDLHVHTPASECFKGKCTPEEIVKTALKAGLDGIAITDHNTADWIDRVKTAAADTPLVIFPGVEISCTGGKKNIHIIALFDPKASSQEVTSVLNLVGIKPSHYGKEEAVSDKGPIEVIETICRNEGLAILAHANSSSGVLRDMTGQPRTRVIQCEKLLGAEATDFNDTNKLNNHRRTKDLLDGKDPNYQRKLAVYQASDNPDPVNSGHHSLIGIGSRYSYFKMERVDLEALKQCLVDPDVRIRQEDELQDLIYPQIRRVSINSGFLSGQQITFHPGLTSILGAKGAGKSLLIEFIRFSLNQEPNNTSILQDHLSKLRSKLGEYGAVEVTFADEYGKETTISRVFRELDGSPFDSSVPYDPSQVFPVLFLSQNEIIAIAENENEQLQFIDRFFDFHTIKTSIINVEKELLRLDKIMADGLRAFTEYDELEIKVKTLDTEIAKIDAALKNPIFEKFQGLERKDKILRSQQEHSRVFFENVNKAREDLLSTPIPTLPEALLTDPSAKRNLILITKAHESTAETLASLGRELKTTTDKVDHEYRTWFPTFKSGKDEYEQYIQNMGGDYKALALARERFVRQRAELQKQLDATSTKKDLVKSISKKREELLDTLDGEYTAYTQQRKAKCEKFMQDSGGKLQLSILDQSNVDRFRESMLSLKRGSYLRDDEIGNITENVTPREFVISLLRYDATKESRHLQKVAEDSKIELKRMKILADFLLSAIPYEDLLALQYQAYPQDRPEILYNIGDNNFVSISNISVGQKCTAMLLMAFSDGTMPIVIDQPEDSLDIRSIWADVCTKVRRGKENRQFIFTTHNSSVAVASDTDCYLIIEGDATQARITHIGAMDHSPVAPEVLKYLEGGSSTYSLKYEKYSDFKFFEENKKK